jgi:hypothetical protein
MGITLKRLLMSGIRTFPATGRGHDASHCNGNFYWTGDESDSISSAFSVSQLPSFSNYLCRGTMPLLSKLTIKTAYVALSNVAWGSDSSSRANGFRSCVLTKSIGVGESIGLFHGEIVSSRKYFLVNLMHCRGTFPTHTRCN